MGHCFEWEGHYFGWVGVGGDEYVWVGVSWGGCTI